MIAIIAIPTCGIAAAPALALVRTWGQQFLRRWLLRAAWGTAALLVVHAVPAIPDWVTYCALGRHAALTAPDRFDLFVYEPWFLIGGILFSLAAWRYQHTESDRAS